MVHSFLHDILNSIPLSHFGTSLIHIVLGQNQGGTVFR